MNLRVLRYLMMDKGIWWWTNVIIWIDIRHCAKQVSLTYKENSTYSKTSTCRIAWMIRAACTLINSLNHIPSNTSREGTPVDTSSWVLCREGLVPLRWVDLLLPFFLKLLAICLVLAQSMLARSVRWSMVGLRPTNIHDLFCSWIREVMTVHFSLGLDCTILTAVLVKLALFVWHLSY